MFFPNQLLSSSTSQLTAHLTKLFICLIERNFWVVLMPLFFTHQASNLSANTGSFISKICSKFTTWTKLAWHLTSMTEHVSVIQPFHLQSILNTVSWVILLKCKSYFCYSSVQSPFVVPVPCRVKSEVLILSFTTLTIWPTVHFLVTLSLFSSYVAFSLTQKLFTWEWLIPHSLQVFTKFHLFSKAFSCHHFQNFNPFPIISHSLFLVYVVLFLALLADNSLSLLFSVSTSRIQVLKGQNLCYFHRCIISTQNNLVQIRCP